MLWRENLSTLLQIFISSLLLWQLGQVGAARHLQGLPGNPVLPSSARRLLQLPSDPGSAVASGLAITSSLGSDPTAGSTSGSGSLLGSGSGGSLVEQSGGSTGSLLKAVQSGSINSSPPPVGIVGVSSPPPTNAMPQLNWNPDSSFNSGTGRRMRAHA